MISDNKSNESFVVDFYIFIIIHLCMKRSIYVLMVVLLALQACIKNAPMNPEADIEAFIVDSNKLVANTIIDQTNQKILLYLQPSAYADGIMPVLQLSEGASVSPASGQLISFDQSVTYTVTSQTGNNKKQYEVVVVTIGSWAFNFEHWLQNDANKYEYPIEDDGTQLWSSGNPGVALSGVVKTPAAYPTHATTQGYNNTMAAEMETIAGTTLSTAIGVRLFAGSIFLGNFNTSNALANPLAATEFGQPYVGKPARFTGYYQYTPGADFQDKDGNILSGVTDQCDIYAILYNGPDRLDGTNIKTSDKIVAKALLQDGSEKALLTRFDIPFEYVDGAVIGDHLMLAIVASSSADGGSYRGAIGSKLIVDSLRIIPQ